MRVAVPTVLTSAAAWTALSFFPDGFPMPRLCSATTAFAPSAQLDLFLTGRPPAQLAAELGLMVTAMIAPLVIGPVRHVRARSFARRRLRSVVLFAGGYAIVWFAACAALTILSALVRSDTAISPAPPICAALVLLWQCAPWKQRCLNRCHTRPALAAHGGAADAAAIRYGFAMSVWCVASCSPLMLLALVLPRGHAVAMALAALWMFSERLENPKTPGWAFHGPGKLVGITLAVAAGVRLRMPSRTRGFAAPAGAVAKPDDRDRERRAKKRAS